MLVSELVCARVGVHACVCVRAQIKFVIARYSVLSLCNIRCLVTLWELWFSSDSRMRKQTAILFGVLSLEALSLTTADRSQRKLSWLLFRKQ